MGYADTIEQLHDDFVVFLGVCRKYQITLGPPKTRFGFKEAQFFGFRINKEGSHLAHLDPILSLICFEARLLRLRGGKNSRKLSTASEISFCRESICVRPTSPFRFT